MAYEVPVLTLSFEAGENLSTAQFAVVRITTSNTVTLPACGALQPIGILQNNPASGRDASVMVMGVSKVRAGAAVSRGADAHLLINATQYPGTMNTSTGTKGPLRTVGLFLQGATQANDIVPVLFNMIPAGFATS
jgi:hypothetical protein